MTPDELYGILLQLFQDPKFVAYDEITRFKRLPSMLRKLLGWQKDDPFLMPLARAIMMMLGEELQLGVDAALGLIRASRAEDSEAGDL